MLGGPVDEAEDAQKNNGVANSRSQPLSGRSEPSCQGQLLVLCPYVFLVQPNDGHVSSSPRVYIGRVSHLFPVHGFSDVPCILFLQRSSQQKEQHSEKVIPAQSLRRVLEFLMHRISPAFIRLWELLPKS